MHGSGATAHSYKGSYSLGTSFAQQLTLLDWCICKVNYPKPLIMLEVPFVGSLSPRRKTLERPSPRRYGHGSCARSHHQEDEQHCDQRARLSK
jgi:hypothetical protein